MIDSYVTKALRDYWIIGVADLGDYKIFHTAQGPVTISALEACEAGSWSEALARKNPADRKPYYGKSLRDLIDASMVAQKRAKPVDFFPSKIDRIAKMPRYPGVWG